MQFKRRHISYALALITLAAGTLTALISWSGRTTARSIVLISIDTLRADRLGAYGYRRDTTPNIDRFAAGATVFEKAITPAPWTLPAHMSMFSGLYPGSHGVHQPGGVVFPAARQLLAEMLKRRGYTTIGLSGAGYMSAKFGFGRGFDSYLDLWDYFPRKNDRRFSSRWAVKRAITELSAIEPGRPYFLFLHTYDAHCPYDPPPSFKGRFISPGAVKVGTGCAPEHSLNRPLTAAEALYISDRYDESISAVDQALSRFFEYLESRPDYENTLIIITADHGEEFLEHGSLGHNTLFRELLEVPLIMRVPGAKPGRISSFVSLVDLVPTVLDLLGAEPAPQIDGQSLLPLIRGETRTERPFEYSELSRYRELRSSISDTTHLIVDLKNSAPLLFDTGQDPLEKESLVSKEPERFEDTLQELQSYMDSLQRGSGDRADTDDQRNLEQLKTLGYF